MPARGHNQAAIIASTETGPLGDLRMWSFLAIRPWCRSDLDALSRLSLSTASLDVWRNLPYFRQLEQQAALHQADTSWLPRQRLRALMAEGVDQLASLLHFGTDKPDSIGAAKVRLEALRILFSSNGLMARAVGDDPRLTAAAQSAIPLDALTDAELDALTAMASNVSARLLREPAEKRAATTGEIDESAQK